LNDVEPLDIFRALSVKPLRVLLSWRGCYSGGSGVRPEDFAMKA
jgi:hypothetical protein